MSGFLNPFFRGLTGPNIQMVGYKADQWDGNNAGRSISLSSYGMQEGDLVVVMFAIYFCSSGDLNLQPTTSGYTEVCDLYGSTCAQNFGVFYKFMGSTPDTDVTLQAFPTTTGNNNWAQARVMIFRGVDPDNPMDVTAVSSALNGVGDQDSPAITPVTTGAVVVDMMACCAGNTLNVPSALSNDGNYSPFTSSKYAKGVSCMAAKRWTGGTLGPVNHGGASSGTSNSANCQIALRPKTVSIPSPVLSFDADIMHWWDIAKDLQLSGTTFQRWMDQKGLCPMFAATGTAPTYSATGMNSKPCLDSQSGSGLNAETTLANDNSMTFVLVARMVNAGSAWGRIMSIGNTSLGGDEGNAGTVTLVRNNTTTNVQIFRAGSGSTNFNAGYSNAYIFEISCNGSDSKLYQNGSLVGTLGSTGANFAVNRVGIFREIASGGQEDGRGLFGDMLIINRALTAGERAELNAYLSAKFL